MRPAAPFLLLLVLAPLAGCLAPPGEDAREAWRFRGTFTRDHTREDELAVCAAVREHNPECGFMESIPPRYGFLFPSRAACESARGRVLAVPHVAGVTPCAREA